jgi:hypothetical protein
MNKIAVITSVVMAPGFIKYSDPVTAENKKRLESNNV